MTPLFSAASYMINPLFSTRSIWLTRFFLIRMWKAPLFWHPGICIYFSLRGLFSWYSMNWLLYLFNYVPAINWHKQQWVVYEFRTIKCMNGAVFLKGQGPVVQSVVSLTSSLRVISLTVLADSIHNILIFFAEKNVSSVCTHIFSAKNCSIFAYHSM